MTIRAATAADIPGVRAMLKEYVDWIGLDLAFQEIDAELAGLPGEYAPPGGALLVAQNQRGSLVGMVGLRPLHAQVSVIDTSGAKTGEMKRLFVRPEGRGQRLARLLVARLLDEARARGYHEIRLDTLPMMGAAQTLYASLGFVDIPPYYDTPIAGTRFMALRLEPGS